MASKGRFIESMIAMAILETKLAAQKTPKTRQKST